MTQRYLIAMLILIAAAVRPAAAGSCSSYASSLVFGNYSGSTVDTTGSVTVTCTSGTPYHVGLNAGNTPGATIMNREMFGGQGGQNTLGYQLFTDAARTINWGDSSGTNWVSGTGNGSAQQYTIYGRIPANEGPPPGNYTDTISASISGDFSTSIAQFSVTTQSKQECDLSATPLTFGGYSGSLLDSTSTITVHCDEGGHNVVRGPVANAKDQCSSNNGPAYDVGLDAGTAPGATVTNRSMSGPNGALLGYKLFQDSKHTLNWGNTIGVDTVCGSGNGTAHLTVYGELPGGQSAASGNYSDTIVVTLTY